MFEENNIINLRGGRYFKREKTTGTCKMNTKNLQFILGIVDGVEHMFLHSVDM